MADKTPEQVVDEAFARVRARTNRPKQPDPPPKSNGLSVDEQIEDGLVRARRKVSGIRDKLIDNLATKPEDEAARQREIAENQRRESIERARTEHEANERAKRDAEAKREADAQVRRQQQQQQAPKQ